MVYQEQKTHNISRDQARATAFMVNGLPRTENTQYRDKARAAAFMVNGLPRTEKNTISFTGDHFIKSPNVRK